MVLSEYYNILGLPSNSSVEEIKKAYRKKARLYHPDINHSPDAQDLFIKLTEAYEFLNTYHEKITTDEQEYNKLMEEWRKYRQDRSQARARFYAQKSYSQFKNTKLYRSTRILNSTTIIFNFSISVMVFIYTILGYILRLKNPIPKQEKPSTIFSFILLLVLSIILFTVSFIYLKAYLQTLKKQRKKT